MKLSELVKGLSDVEIRNFSERDIEYVTATSERAGAGVIFVAIKGARYNGADFIHRAHKLGTRVFVTECKSVKEKDSVIICSKNTRKTLAELCAKLSGNPEKSLSFIGVTGTKGKTTTSVMLSKILDGIGVRSITVGTLGVLGVGWSKTKNTTPDPTVLFPLFAEAKRQGIEVVIIEVSSQALKDFRVFGIEFSLVAFTGLGKDHIGGAEHPSFSDYIMSKRKLFSEYGAGCAVVNFDDPYSSYMTADVARVIKCGFSEGARYRITHFSDTRCGADFKVDGINVSIGLPGMYNARNAAIALALAKEITGAPISVAARYIAEARVSGRFEIQSIDGKNIVIDYAHNYDSMCEVISLSRRLFGGRIICVFGSVGGRSYKRRRELASAAEKYADMSVITTDNPGFELPLSVCADIYAEFSDKTRAKIIVDRGEAISYAINEAGTGDCVMLLGRGHEDTMYYGNGEISFSDSEYIKAMKENTKKKMEA